MTNPRRRRVFKPCDNPEIDRTVDKPEKPMHEHFDKEYYQQQRPPHYGSK